MDSSRAPSRPHYTCLIRLPFPRGDFVDPAPVDWDASKDKALWKLISKAANSKDLDWPELSNKFQVSLPFLLQQAAWLYERHFAQMRAQMKKLGASNAPSPVPAQEAIAAAPGGQRPASRGSRAPSSLSIHAANNSPSLTGGPLASPVRPNAPPMSRTPSTRTVTQSRYPSSQHDHRPFRSSFGSHQRKPVVLDDITGESPSPPMASSSSSAISSSSDERPTHPSVAKSQVFRRPPDLRTISSEGDAEDDDDDDDDSSAGFLPFASREHNVSNSSDPAATLRRPSATDRTSQIRQEALSPPAPAEAPYDQRRRSSATEPQRIGARPSPPPQPQQGRGSDRPSPAARATTSPPLRPGSNSAMLRNQSARGAGALSPRHRAEVLSGRQSKGSSEGTPSMGSSFSDLDDASVTQSALDDAILSNMQNVGAASRMSSFSQALRSKYLPQ